MGLISFGKLRICVNDVPRAQFAECWILNIRQQAGEILRGTALTSSVHPERIWARAGMIFCRNNQTRFDSSRI
jgi:hypothetical protein